MRIAPTRWAIGGSILVSLLAPVVPVHAIPPQFESPHVRPLAFSANRLLVVNTPDNRLSVFDWNAGDPVLASEIKVGMEPVTVAPPSERYAWVVNHLSDDITVVDVILGAPVATIVVGDEPTQVVFIPNPVVPEGPRWAVIALSQEDRLVVHETEYPYAFITSIDLPAADPRTLTLDAAGTGVWVAAFESANRTTLIPRSLVPSGPWSGNDPPLPPIVPPLNPDLPDSLFPANGVIVRKIGGSWLDEQGGNWTSLVTWDLADIDVMHVAFTTGTPVIDRTVSDVGTLLADLTIDPVSGDVWVANTEAHNEILFEPKIRGEFASANVTRIPAAGGPAVVHTLNGHVSFGPPGQPAPPSSPAVRENSISSPTEVLYSLAGGAPELYVSGIGGKRVAVVDVATGAVVRRLPVPRGLTGLVESPDHSLIVAVDRFANTIRYIDPSIGVTGFIRSVGKSGFDPTPANIRRGREHLYSAELSAHGTVACASCHPDANEDGIAWDLGDPQGELVQLDSALNNDIVIPPFHPLKGPLVTQSLRGLEDVGFLHWRGDRFDFTRFNPAFMALLGGLDTLSVSEMNDFRDFILAIRYPPNPFRDLSDAPPPFMPNGGDPVAGEHTFLTNNDEFCIKCHEMPRGTHGFVVPIDETMGVSRQPLKVPHLRNLYEKIGFLGAGHLDNKRGFGFEHDGMEPSVEGFTNLFSAILTPTERTDVAAFLQTFPTGLSGGVAQQVTLDSTNVNDALVLNRYFSLKSDAEIGSLDLIVTGYMAPATLVRGWTWIGPESNGTFQSDRGDEIWTEADLTDAIDGGAILTFTGVPVGQGIRMGVDRDEDGAFDLTEVEAGSDPADPSSLPTLAVEPPSDAAVRALTRVTSVFPQPFSTQTTLEIYLPVSGRAKLEIFDVSGRRVRSLLSGKLGVGRHVVRWDARDERGTPIAPGSYQAVLTTDRARHAVKVIHLP